MNRLLINWRLMDAAGGEGGGGAGADAGNGEPGNGGTSAAAKHAGDGEPGTGNGEPGTGNGEPGNGEPGNGGTSAAAKHAGDAGNGEPGTGKGEPGNGGEDVDLAKMSDEDWAKAVMPDPEKDGDPKPDRTLLAPMAKELREAGIQPAAMKKVVAAYDRSLAAYMKTQDEARAARMKELTEKCEKEITPDQWKNFSAAYREIISKDEALKELVDHTELGSSPAFVRICALAGASVRVDRQPPATGAAGSSRNDTDRAVFLATVPQHLR